jgi:internalin A
LTALPPEFGQLTSLQGLDLSGNQLTALPPEFGRLTKLQKLWLFANQLSALPAEFGQLTNLQLLDLDENPLAEPLPGLVTKGIPALLAHLQSLAMPSRPISGGAT